MVILPSLHSNKAEVFVISYKVKKTFKKVLTKKERRDIIVKLSPRGKPRGGWQRSLKIEQQEIKYKAIAR